MLAAITAFVAKQAAAWGVAELSKRFMSSKAALVGAGVLGAFVLYEVGNLRGYSRATEKCKAAAIQTELRTVKTDLAIQRKAAETAQQERDTLAAKAAELQDKVAKYEEAFSKSPAGACALSVDDVRRLRNIGK